MAILGGAAFARTDETTAGRWLGHALDAGVNHIDVAPSYGDAEAVLGPHLPAVRDRVFLACKTRRRSPEGVRAQLEESLTRLRTDHLDLYQLHAVTALDVLEERSGAVRVALAAREEGLVRFVGITGHDLGAPAAHLEALRRWDLDTVMFPVYPRVWADPAYRADAEALLAECATRDVGVMAIKAVARRPWGAGDRFATTWYEPFTADRDIATGIGFALSTPGVQAFCTPGDLELLPRVLAAADSPTLMPGPVRDAAMTGQAALEVIFPLAEKAAR